MNCVFHEAESGLIFDVTGISSEISKANETFFFGVGVCVCGGVES